MSCPACSFENPEGMKFCGECGRALHVPTACPGCGRTTSSFFQEMAQDIQGYIKEQMPQWRRERPGVAEMSVAVMGCVVNGPGESKHANLGISLPGTAEEPKAPVYLDGALHTTLKGDRIVAEFLTILEEYVVTHYRAEDGGVEADPVSDPLPAQTG